MQPATHFRFGLALALATTALSGATLPATTSTPAIQTADLQVTIDVPPTWRPFLDDDVAEALAGRLISLFRKRGYSGRMVQLKAGTTAANGVPQITIRLIEWRIGRSGQADCTLSASIRSPAGEKDLGLISSSAIFWPHASGHWGLNRSYDTDNALEDAAESAMRDLYGRLVKTGLIPSLGLKK